MWILFFFWSAVLWAEPLPPPHTIGLLELPQLFGQPDCGKWQPEPLAFFGEAGEGAELGEIRVESAHRLPDADECLRREVVVQWADEANVRWMTTEELADERRGAFVTEQAGEWFRILLADRLAWIKPRADARFHLLRDLYRSQTAYLSNAWDGRICSRPGLCRMTSISADTAPGVEVLETRLLRGKRWFKVSFVARGVCREEDEAVPGTVGWVPAYGTDNKPTIWFHSRSC